MLKEHLVHVLRIGEAGFIGDLKEGLLLVLHQADTLLHALHVHVFLECDVEKGCEEMGEMGGGEVLLAREVLHADLRLEVRVDIRDDAIDTRGPGLDAVFLRFGNNRKW